MTALNIKRSWTGWLEQGQPSKLMQTHLGKAERELGWQANVPFETGLRETVRWYLANRGWWQAILSGAYRLERLGSDQTLSTLR